MLILVWEGMKCAAYLAYWWLQRQPLTFSVPEDKYKEFFDKATQEDVARVIHANAFWLVVYVFSELFTAKELPCAKENPHFQKQWKFTSSVGGEGGSTL